MALGLTEIKEKISSELARSALFGGIKLNSLLAIDYFRCRLSKQSPPPPRLIQVEPTRSCNLGCMMCLRTQDPSPGSMSIDLFKRIMRRDFAYPHFLLLYGQGEPFLAKDLFEMIRFSKDLGNWVTTVTNGTIMNHEIYQKIEWSGLDLLRISIDGGMQETLDRVRPGSNIEKIFSNLTDLSDYIRKSGIRTKLAVSFMVLKENYREIPLALRLCHRLGIKYFEIKDMPPYLDSPVKPLQQEFLDHPSLKDEVKHTVFESQQLARKAGISFIKSKFNCIGGYTSCMNPWFKTFVTYDGKVKLCSKMFSKESPEMGDLKINSFEEIWYGIRYKDIRVKLTDSLTPFDECKTYSQAKDES